MPVQPSGTSTGIHGQAAAPAASGIIAVQPNIPAGLYKVTLTVYIDGTVVTATDDDNIKLAIITANPGNSTVNLAVTTVPVTYDFWVNSAAPLELAVEAIAAASASAVYHAQLTWTLYEAG